MPLFCLPPSLGMCKYLSLKVKTHQIEREMGLKFFTNLPAGVRSALLAKMDSGRDD